MLPCRWRLGNGSRLVDDRLWLVADRLGRVLDRPGRVFDWLRVMSHRLGMLVPGFGMAANRWGCTADRSGFRMPTDGLRMLAHGRPVPAGPWLMNGRREATGWRTFARRGQLTRRRDETHAEGGGERQGCSHPQTREAETSRCRHVRTSLFGRARTIPARAAPIRGISGICQRKSKPLCTASAVRPAAAPAQADRSTVVDDP